ncbi:MAG: prolyl oligopeptidase family serine peptidase, partial [Verrucomicrobiota bacterium]
FLLRFVCFPSMVAPMIRRLLLATLCLTTSSQVFAQGDAIFKKWDKNGDGFLEKDEVPEGPRKIFDQKDKNGDGKISLEEHKSPPGKMNRPPQPERPDRPTPPSAGGSAFTINQTWHQEPQGYDRPVYVAEPQTKKAGTPIVIHFHGNGGSAERTPNSWSRHLPDHLIVAPQGYERSWNIQGEKSLAPDVEFFRQVVAEVLARYPYADKNKVSLVGSSNGGAYIYRLLIEVNEPLFQKAVPTVSSLLVAQHHDEKFWKSKTETDTETLDVPVEAVDSGRSILYVHGTDDKVVPFEGGKRFGKFDHHSAIDTANILAEHFGYQGPKVELNDGEEITDGLLMHSFGDTPVQFLAVKDGNHGLAPHREAAQKVIIDFIRGN